MPETVASTSANWPHSLTEPAEPRWVVRGLGAVCVGLVLFTAGLGLLALADFSGADLGSADPRVRAQRTLQRGDHLHFAVHIVAARILDVCPCTRRAAGAQYWRAHFHALTPRQVAVANNTHPRTLAEWVDYVTGPADVTFAWLGDALGWLGGGITSMLGSIAED